MACRREAVASCRLDGSRITLRDLLWWEMDGGKADRLGVSGGEARICANYAEALGSMLPESGPARDEAVSQKGLCSLHKALFARLRGRDDRPGELRKTLIWLGPAGSTAATAHFVPPLPQRVPEQVDRLQAFWRRDTPLPPLARIALVYLQLESLHPFVDGSGRVSRLCLLRMLQSAHGPWPPLLTPSEGMAADVGEHFRQQQRARIQGDWEGWIRYFARRLGDAADAAAVRLERMDAELREHEERIGQHMAGLRQTAGALLGSWSPGLSSRCPTWPASATEALPTPISWSAGWRSSVSWRKSRAAGGTAGFCTRPTGRMGCSDVIIEQKGHSMLRRGWETPLSSPAQPGMGDRPVRGGSAATGPGVPGRGRGAHVDGLAGRGQVTRGG